MSNEVYGMKVFGEPSLEDVALLNHTLVHGTSFLAAKLCREEHKQQVCRSGAGYYIGANDFLTGEPVSRDSVEYWPTQKEAEEALESRSWTQRLEA